MIRKFLEVGVENGEITFYATIDPGKAKPLLDQRHSSLYLFICNPQADKVVKDSPNVFKLKGVENLTEISIALNAAYRTLDKIGSHPRRACLEIISDVLLQHHAVQTRRWLNALIPELKLKGFTTLAVMDSKMHPSQEVRAVLDLFDGEINIYRKATKSGLGKILKVEKMIHRKYIEGELPLGKERLKP